MMEKYALSDPQGMLVIRGAEAEGVKSDHVFIKFRDLFSQESTGRRGPLTYAFLGENALYNALVELIEGKLVLYFTQGHGEMTLESNEPRMPGMRPRPGGDLSVLKQKLTERKSVEVKSLTVNRSLKKVPDDASVVVVARPTQAFLPEEMKVLRDYVKRSAKMRTTKEKDGRVKEEEEVTAGKLILLFNPVIHKEGDRATMAPTGLEPLLAEYNVKLGNDRILSVQSRDPLAVMIALTSPTSPNPVARAFNSPDQQTVFQFRNVRTVEPFGERPGPVAVERLMLVPSQYGFWAESRLLQDPSALRTELLDDPQKAEKLFDGRALCMAVAVSETSGGGAPRDLAHAGVTKETPRMVVFGAADWINDEALIARGASRMDLFNSCVSWVREKSSIGKVIPPKQRKEYELNIPPQETGRLYYLPPALMFLGIIGLGTGVWVVRRR
jgi:hypothetical protein